MLGMKNKAATVIDYEKTCKIIMDLSENSFHIHYQPMVIKYDDDDVVVVIVVNDYC